MAICVALALGTLLLYAPVLSFDFINLNDPQYVINNFHVHDGLGWRGLAWSFQTGYGGNWIPLVWLSYMLDYQFHGLKPAGYHATNVLLHAANAVLVFLVLKRMTGTFWRSAMVAALFAWHPMHVESVAWISERKDVLSTLFWMLTMLAYLNYAGKGGVGRYFLVLFLFAVGLMAKPMLVTLPFVLLLLDWWPLCRFQPTAPGRLKTSQLLILEKIPMLLMAAGCSLLTALVQSQVDAIVTLGRFPLLPRLENAVVSYGRYIKKLIWPADLSSMYPLHAAWPLSYIVVVIIILAVISDTAIRFRKSFPYLMLGWLWYLGTLVPVIGIVQVGAEGMADRYTYIPSIGLFIMVCWGVFDLVQFGAGAFDNQILKKHSQWILGSLCLAALVMYGLDTGKQLQYWQNGGTLFSRALELDPNNYGALNTYGMFLCEHGSLPKAIESLRRAVQIKPNGPNGHASLGHALYIAGEGDAAATELSVALNLKPNLVVTRNELGSILLDKKQPAEAAAEFSTALQYEPDNATTHYLMGKALAMQGRQIDAQEQFSEALRLNPELIDAH